MVSAVIAVAVFVVAYVLIATERVPKTVTALAGAGDGRRARRLVVRGRLLLPETGVDWDVIFLLLGMMIIVGVLRRTGVFEFIAIWAAKRAKGSPLRVMILLVLITAVASAFLDNVTTVLLIAPVTLLVCDRLGVIADPVPDRRGAGLQHRRRRHLDRRPAEHHHRQPVRTDVQRLPDQHGADRGPGARRRSSPCCRCCSAARSHVDPERVADVMALNEREAIKDRRLLIMCGVVLAAVFTGFIGHTVFHVEPSVVALLGAGRLGADLAEQAARLHAQRRVGDAAVLRRPVHHGRRAGQDRRHRPDSPTPPPARPAATR